MTKEEIKRRSDQYLLIPTGHRGTRNQRSRFHVALFAGHAVALSNAAFVLLLELVRARVETHTGYLRRTRGSDPEAFRLGVYRLRRQIDACLGPGEGNRWVTAGILAEYKLQVPPDKIAVDLGFSELPQALVSEDLRDYLVEHCPEVALDQLP